jgi:hypothetical protein
MADSPDRGIELEPAVLPTSTLTEEDRAALEAALARIAETERSGGFSQGMAFAESALRERAGDYSGSVIAAYKELAFAYARGDSVNPGGIRDSLIRLSALSDQGPAALAVLDFQDAHWEQARIKLEALLGDDPDPDSFGRWMILVSALEGGGASPAEQSAYRSIRARWGNFPEYWYRGARNLGEPGASEYAERCINLAPQGPYAAECRGMLVGTLGLGREAAAQFRTRQEIEACVRRSMEAKDPELLRDLFPLITLRDNPYTLYTLALMRSLVRSPEYRRFFSEEAAAAKPGRLEERLDYISRG